MKDLTAKKHWKIKSEINLKKLINSIEGADFSEVIFTLLSFMKSYKQQ